MFPNVLAAGQATSGWSISSLALSFRAPHDGCFEVRGSHFRLVPSSHGNSYGDGDYDLKAVTSPVPVIHAFSQRGEVVLDAFAGSGSTCAAALLTGRSYIGIELDPEYHANAESRMQRVHGRIAVKRQSSVSCAQPASDVGIAA